MAEERWWLFESDPDMAPIVWTAESRPTVGRMVEVVPASRIQELEEALRRLALVEAAEEWREQPTLAAEGRLDVARWKARRALGTEGGKDA